ncbi:MAG: substrate-binding domain-containing protein [Chloroflexi bacterium]|nr:substrate-binding domain-containing protein [Chloroflexota bacterium]
MKRYWLLTVIYLLVACGQNQNDIETPSAPSISLLISGSGGTTPVLAYIAPNFTADHPNYRILTLQGSSTDGGINALRENLIDIAAMSRAATASEMETITYIKIGLAGEVPIIHPAAALTDITSEELRAVFAGEISNWSELGGADLAIQVYVRGDSSIHTHAMRKAVFNDIVFTENAVLASSMENMIDIVDTTPGAVGYASYPAVLATRADVIVLGFDSVDPISNAYPGLLEIGLSYLPDREPDIAPFVAWLLSDEGQAALRELRVVP